VNIRRKGGGMCGKVSIPIAKIRYWEDLMVGMVGKKVYDGTIKEVFEILLNNEKVENSAKFDIRDNPLITAVCELKPGVYFFVCV
jgi:hypothetical protein